MSRSITWGKRGTRLSNKAMLIEYLKESTYYSGNCWLYWGGSESDGYKRVRIDGLIIGVHRLSAYIHLGLDLNDNNLQANHKPECTSKICWNPEHLYVGTHKQNLQDYMKKGHYNSMKTHCKLGHLLTKSTTPGHRQCRICKNEKTLIRQRKMRSHE